MPVDARGNIVDGFTLSQSLPLLQVSYRAQAQAQMEVLRKANGYGWAAWTCPSIADPTASSSTSLKVVPAYGQVEEQWTVPPGSYLWGWGFTSPAGEGWETAQFYVLMTDSCTETPLFADYVNLAPFNQAAASGAGTGQSVRGPQLLCQPRLVSDPGKVNVEIYNNAASDALCQFVAFFAVPVVRKGK